MVASPAVVRVGALGLEPGLARARRLGRGFTLIELLVVVVLAALLTTMVIAGMGAATNARLKGATTIVAAAIRSAYTRSSAVAKPHRVVFDFKESKVWIEEGAGNLLVTSADVSNAGGADPATEAERKAIEQTDKILRGPRPPKTSFKPVKGISVVEEDGVKVGRSLGTRIRFREILVSHQVDAVRDGRAYLYTWPGGATELAYIQVAKGEQPSSDDTMTLFVHPLTGKVKIVAGAKTIRVDEQASEREDRILLMARRDEVMGFTLLEVMVAVAILGLSLTVILSAQVGLFSSGTYGQHVSEATGLARCKMSELEEQFLKLGYPELDSNDEGACCAGDSRQDMRCSWKIERVELPNPTPGGDPLADGGLGAISGLPGMGGPSPVGSAGLNLGGLGLTGGDPGLLGMLGSDGGAPPGVTGTSGLAGMMSSTGGSGGILAMAMSIVYPMLKPMLEASIRRVTVTVMWREGLAKRELEVLQWVTNPTKGGFFLGGPLDSASAGLPGSSPTSTSTRTSTTASPTTTSTAPRISR